MPHTIVTPVRESSSRAVFYVDEALQLHFRRLSEIYPSVDEAKAEILIHSASVSLDSWIGEEATLDAADKPAALAATTCQQVIPARYFTTVSLVLHLRRAKVNHR